MFGARSSEFAGEIDKSKARSVFVGGIGQPHWERRDGATGGLLKRRQQRGLCPGTAPSSHPAVGARENGDRSRWPRSPFPAPGSSQTGEFSSKEI